MEKKCCTCKKVVPISEFHKAKSRPDGLSPRCKSCTKDACAKSYAKRSVEDEQYILVRRERSRVSANKKREAALKAISESTGATCDRCGEFKSYEEFGKSRKHMSGRLPTCLKCSRRKRLISRRGIKQRHYRKYKQRISEFRKEKRRNNPCPSDRSVLRFASGLRKFGLTPAMYLEILRSQDMACAICRKRFSDFQYRLAVDHDHETGEVRGLLCGKCNQCLGAFGDNLAGIQKVVDYLENPPAKGKAVAL